MLYGLSTDGVHPYLPTALGNFIHPVLKYHIQEKYEDRVTY